MKKTRVLIADDHEVVRQGVKALLSSQSHIEICGEAVSGREAVDSVIARRPDVIILDITMPGLNGLQAARLILRAAPRTHILVLSMHDSEQVIREAIEIGVRGYLLKSDAGRDLVTALNAICQGSTFFTSDASRIILDGFLDKIEWRGAEQDARHRLTSREHEVTQLLAEGKSNKEIGGELNISTKTVETHRANIMRKLNLRSLPDLVRYAVRNNIIQP